MTEKTIGKLYPDGFTGWDIEHGGVLETSLMMSLYPELVQMDWAMDWAVDHPPATFPPYDVYPVNPDWIPPSGTLSSPAQASKEKGDILLEVCTKGIIEALEFEFGLDSSENISRPEGGQSFRHSHEVHYSQLAIVNFMTLPK